MSWEFMIAWLRGDLRTQEDATLVALVSAHGAGFLGPGTVHKKLTK